MARRNTLKIDVLADVTKAEKEIERFAGKIKYFGRHVKDIGEAMSKISAPLIAIGGLAGKAAIDIDEALDRIQAGTGATGTAMAGLEADFKAVASAVPQSFGETAGVLSDLNTRLGISGQLLQDVAISAMDASRLLGSNLTETVTQSARAIQNWGVPAAQVPKTLDKLFVASQQSGIGMDKLSAQMTQFGPILRTAGVDLDTTIALLSGFERQGVNTEAVMAGLKTALGKLADSGVPTANALTRLIGGIRSAQTPTEAMKRAVELFGKKAGPELAAAIREGRFGVDEMAKSLATASGAIQKTARDTDGFAEQWGRMRNDLAIALEPLGKSLLEIAEGHIPELRSALKGLDGDFGRTTVEVGLFLAALGPGTWLVGGWVSNFGKLAKTLSAVIAPLKLSGREIVTLAALFGDATKSVSSFVDWVRLVPAAMAPIGAAMLAHPIGVIATALATAAIAMKTFGDSAEQSARKIRDFKESLKMTDEQAAMLEVWVPGVVIPKESELPMANGKKEFSASAQYYSAMSAAYKTRIMKELAGKGNVETSAASGFGAVEKAVERIRDQIRYMHADGRTFLGILDAWQSKTAPLSEKWKKIADLKIDIRNEAARQAAEETVLALNASETARAYADQVKDAKSVEDSLTRQQDALAAMARYWESEAFGNRLGLLPDPAYMKELEAEFAKLQGELSGKGIDASNWYNWTDEMKARFAEVQEVAGRVASSAMEALQGQFQNGAIGVDAYRMALQGVLSQFGQYPAVVKEVENAIKGLDSATAASAVSIGRLAREAETALRDKMAQVPDELAGAFAGAIVNCDNLGDALQSLLKDIAYLIVKATILRSVMGIFGWGGGSVGSGLSGGVSSIWRSGGASGTSSGLSMAGSALTESGVSLPSTAMSVPARSGFDEARRVPAREGIGSPTINISISAMDAPSFARYMESNRGVLEGIVVGSIMRNGAVRRAMQGA